MTFDKESPIPVVVNKYREPYDVYIGRGSLYGNPFHMLNEQDRGMVIEQYEKHVRSNKRLMGLIPGLAGKRLGCFCKPKACHGDVLVKIFIELRESLPRM